MYTQTLDAHAAQHSKTLPRRVVRSKPGKTMITIVLSGAIVLAIAVTTWTMLRAEFTETFHELSACHVVAPDRAA